MSFLSARTAGLLAIGCLASIPQFVSFEQIITLLGAVSLLSLIEKTRKKIGTRLLQLARVRERYWFFVFVSKYPPDALWCLLVCLLLLLLPRVVRVCCVSVLPVSLPTYVLSFLSLSLSVAVDIYVFYCHECVSVSSISTCFQKNDGALMVKLLNNRTYELT
jgi:hypothetical protein